MSDVIPFNTLPKTSTNDNKRFQLWQLIFALNTGTENLADEHTLANGPPSELSIDALNTATPNLADKPTLADGPPQVVKNRCLEYHYTKPGRQTYIAWWTPQYQSRDTLNTSTQNMADEPTLANGPPKVTEQRCLHTATDI